MNKLHQQYQNRSLVVLGFTCNNFNQEGKNDKEVANVYNINYGVTFDMFAPVAVTGPDAHALFKALAAQSSAPGWNFNEYLVNAEGKVVEHFDGHEAGY